MSLNRFQIYFYNMKIQVLRKRFTYGSQSHKQRKVMQLVVTTPLILTAVALSSFKSGLKSLFSRQNFCWILYFPSYFDKVFEVLSFPAILFVFF